MERQANKVVRIKQIEDLLRIHKDGFSLSEIARRIGVNRSTVWRYYQDGDLSPLFYEMGTDGKLRLDAGRLRFNVNLDLEEAMALHLAVRLFSKRMDRKNPRAASAIRQIGQEVKKVAPRIGEAMSKSADLIDAGSQIYDGTYIQVLKTLTRAWANTFKVHIHYRNEQTGIASQHTVSPYYIEPYSVGQSSYLFGWSDEKQSIRTYKLERIDDIQVLPDRYTIPDSFEIDRFLANAWGIWTAQSEPEKILLRFSPKVAARVRESRWHPSQRVEDQVDGSLVWEATIANWREMLPWILGWGGDVEVLEPVDLVDRISEEAALMINLYANAKKK